MKELTILFFFVISVPSLLFLYGHKNQSSDYIKDEKFITLNFSHKSVEIYNKIMEEIGMAMSIYRGALASNQIKPDSNTIEKFKKDNQKTIDMLNKNLKLCMRSKSREDFFSNINNMTIIAIEYEIQYNLSCKDKHIIRKKYYDIQKSITESDL